MNSKLLSPRAGIVPAVQKIHPRTDFLLILAKIIKM